MSAFSININAAAIGSESINTVNARDLHAFLEVGRDFSSWIKNRIEVYGFAENVDYVTAQNLSSPKRGSSKSRPQLATDYLVSIDMAKELAMVERTEKGRQVRRYFISLAVKPRGLARGYKAAIRIPCLSWGVRIANIGLLCITLSEHADTTARKRFSHCKSRI